MRAAGWGVVLLLAVLPLPAGQAILAFSPDRLASDPVYGDGGPSSPPSNETSNGTPPDDAPPEGVPVEERDFCVISSDVGMYCTEILMPDPEAAPALPDPGAPEQADGAGTASTAEPVTDADAAPDEPVPAGATGQESATGSHAEATDQRGVPAGPSGPAPPPGRNEPQPLAPHGERMAVAGKADGATPGGVRDSTWVALALALPWALGLKAALLLALRRGGPASGVREQVLALVAADPGLRHAELVRRLGRGNGTVEHHVRALLAEGRLARLRRGGSTGYYPATMPEEQAGLRLALQGATARRLAAAVAREPGLRLTDVARRAGVSSPTAHYHLRRLVAAGVLDAGEGRFAVRAEARPLLAQEDGSAGAAATPPPLPTLPASPATFALEPRGRIADLAQDTPV